MTHGYFVESEPYWQDDATGKSILVSELYPQDAVKEKKASEGGIAKKTERRILTNQADRARHKSLGRDKDYPSI